MQVQPLQMFQVPVQPHRHQKPSMLSNRCRVGRSSRLGVGLRTGRLRRRKRTRPVEHYPVRRGARVGQSQLEAGCCTVVKRRPLAHVRWKVDAGQFDGCVAWRGLAAEAELGDGFLLGDDATGRTESKQTPESQRKILTSIPLYNNK